MIDIQSMRDTVGYQYKKPNVNDLVMFRDSISLPSAQDFLKIKRNLSDETIKRFGLGYDPFRNNISIPEMKNSEIVNVAYRAIEDDAKIKYIKEKGCENWIFNQQGLEEAKKKGRILVTSNQFDCMSAYQAGMGSVVSIPVGKDSNGMWMELFDNIPKVYTCFENNKQGKKYALEFAERIGSDKCFEIQLPEDSKDLNDYFKKNDMEQFKVLVNNAKPYYSYKFKGLNDVIDLIREKKENVYKFKCIPYVEFEEDWIAVISGVSNAGKCHGKGTKIMMYDGSIKNVEDVKVGDKLMGVDSKPRDVLSLARGKENMYRVHERDDYYDVNESHILSLQKRRKHKKTGVLSTETFNMCLRDYLKLSPITQRAYRGWKTKVNFEEKDITIDPYLLGLWLGDGTSANTGITTADKEIKEYIESSALSLGLLVRETIQPNNASNVYTINSGVLNKNSLLTNLQNYDLLNNKYIPSCYKTNDEFTRLQLLAGLIDTDGSLCKTKFGEYYEIIQKSNKLSEDIVYLARSLGYRVVSRKSIKEIKSIGFKGEYNRIMIVGDLGRIPVKLERKKSNFVPKKQWLTSLLKIESLGYGDYYGFTLSGDGLYLLSTFTVTHNTTHVLNIANELGQDNIPVLILPFERGIKTVGKRFLQVRTDKTQYELEAYSNSQLDDLVKDVSELPIYFSTPSREQIRDTIARAKKIFGTKVVIVDHLDYLVRKSTENHNVETSNTLQEFKSLAQEFNILFLIVHHIKKQEGTGSVPKKPKMEDLKGSSSTYQDPEAVIMLSSPEKGQLEVDIVKNKGEMGSKIYNFNTMTGKIGLPIEYTPETMTEKQKTQQGFDKF